MRLKYCISVKLMLFVTTCGFAASTIAQPSDGSASSAPPAAADSARLVVTRSADFGIHEIIHLYIDGVQVTDILYNQSYETALPPGEHVLTISTNPNAYGGPTEQRVNFEAGKIYAFTAVWNDPERASLEPLPAA